MAKLSRLDRLDPENITDVLIRGRFYRELRKGSSDWDDWEVSVDEIDKPELISFRYYGTPKLKKVVAVCAGVKDLRNDLQPGSVISLPPIVWVRNKIRDYCEFEKQ